MELMWLVRTAFLPPLQAYIKHVLVSSAAVKMAFILDCTAVPEIISLCQSHGEAVTDTALYITRTYAYSIHRKKLILTGRWPYAAKDSDCSDLFKISKTCVSGTTELTMNTDQSDVPAAVPSTATSSWGGVTGASQWTMTRIFPTVSPVQDRAIGLLWDLARVSCMGVLDSLVP